MAGEDIDAEDRLGGGEVGVKGGEEDKQRGCDMHGVEAAEFGICGDNESGNGRNWRPMERIGKGGWESKGRDSILTVLK